ncbi:MAG: NAD(P)-dependent alcohol dehydrogenase [SAR202 cluster bacterium]|jgi:NADPH:quinone reductase-like Zn-dependent oxidoreductase|nr:NAD(P)-dependent alcohol dehydrogenase [SAR202 cluster bacterium]MDP6716461.1 NAD(P)-dependent alcohol dehydrogenase [SAR202 cluster bacterium]
MKAVVYHQYGSPDVLESTDIDTPTVRDDGVVVKVHAASVNPLDWHNLRGDPFIARLSAGFLKPKNKILGADIAGRVEAVGSNVKQFQPGDEVFGGSGVGGFAEYVCVAENNLVLKPSDSSFEEAASVPVAALTALQGLRDNGQIQPGRKVLINGAAGGVGTFAVQIAKSFETEVTGVTSTRNLAMVRKIGADHVIDYTKEDFTRNGQQYDLIADAVGNRSVSDVKRVLSPSGICVVIGFSSLALMFQVLLLGSWTSLTSSKKVGLMLANINQTDLNTMKALLESGKVTPVIDRQYTLNEVAEALRYLEKGRAQGKVVITV